MAKKLPSLSLKLDTSAIAGQFRNLRGRHAGLWPPLPRGLLMLALFASIVAAGYALYWRGLFEELEAGRQQERDRNGLLVMEATAKTFRYLDPEEIAQQRAAAATKKAAEVKK